MTRPAIIVLIILALAGAAAYALLGRAPQDPSASGPGAGYATIGPDELRTELAAGDLFLVDVHVPEQEHIGGTDAFVPYDRIAESAAVFPEDKDARIVVYCRSGSMSRTAAQALADMGYTDVAHLEGGINAYNRTR